MEQSQEDLYLEPVIIPNFVYKIWKERLKQNYNTEITRDILEILLKTYYVRSTWKWQRAYKNIVEMLMEKGYTMKESKIMAKKIVGIFDGSIKREWDG